MNQRLTSSRFPYLPIRIHTGPRLYPAGGLLDTGFDGAVAVPAGLVVGREPDMYLRWTLPDESIVTAPTYRGIVYLGDFAPLPSFITALGDEYLIGRAITDQFAVTLDHGPRVIVEP